MSKPYEEWIEYLEVIIDDNGKRKRQMKAGAPEWAIKKFQESKKENEKPFEQRILR